MSIGDMDSLHMNGDVTYISHGEHAKFFAVRNNGDTYYHKGEYIFLEGGLESLFNPRL